MAIHTSIQFLVQELLNNENDLKRVKEFYSLDKIGLQSRLHSLESFIELKRIITAEKMAQEFFFELGDMGGLYLIDACLSRLDGKAVLSALEGTHEVEPKQGAFFEWEWWKQHANTLIHLVREEQLVEMRYDDERVLPIDIAEYLSNLSETVSEYYPKTKSELLYGALDRPKRNGLGLEAGLIELDKYFVEEEGGIKLKM